MPKLIKHGVLADNPWTLIGKDTDIQAVIAEPAEHLLVPLALWLESKEVLLATGKAVAVWLDSDERPDSLQDDLDILPMIALNFPGFMDGRSYTSATSLRQRFGYTGEVRAIGDVLRDQLYLMKRCGFDAFDVSDEVSTEDALSAFNDFSTSYASTIEEPLPLFRRRQA